MTAAGHSDASEIASLEKTASWTVGSIGYLVSTTWWNSWVQYSSYAGPTASTLLQLPGGGGPRPGPISNADLLPPGYTSPGPPAPGATIQPPLTNPEDVPLRPGLVEQQDFVVVSAASWQRLHSLYSGSPAIARRVVADAPPGPSGRNSERWCRVALYPLRLEVSYKDKASKEASCVLSIEPEASLAVLKARACAALGVSEAEVALWDYSGRSAVRSLEAAASPRVADAAADASTTAAAADATPTPMAIEESAAAAGSDVGAASTSMDVDVAPPASGAAEGAAAGVLAGAEGSLGRSLRELGLLESQPLLLRRKDAPGTESEDDDACGSDNDAGAPAVRKQAGRKAAAGAARGARAPAGEAAGTAAMRRASAAGGRSDTGSAGSGAAAAAPAARTSGGGSAPAFGGGNRLSSQRSSLGASDDVMLRDGQLPGLAGLSNLGNTCFMNSSLQCLAHAVPLMSSFLGSVYLQDINRTNPLGMKGELAEAFGSLMGQLWRGGVSAVTPRAFKAKIGRFAPQFSGYAQHDSQEFLAFLLDGLHEDTNRIKVKPYVEEKDLPGRPDEEVAAEAWDNYRSRNNSLVVDHFQGLFKSTVDCPQCSFNSVKFDPFMYLSLPLPESRRRMVEVVLVRTDGSELPCRMALELPSGAAVVDLLQAAATLAGLSAEVQAAPDSHLLAARPLRSSPTSNTDELVVLSDHRMRVADALDAGGAGMSSYSLRSSAANSEQGLVVYYYPDASRGPRAEGLAPVIVHFKRPDSRRTTTWARGVWCGAPLVLYMPDDRPPYDPEQVVKQPVGGVGNSSNRSEYEISGDCPLESELFRVLRPIQRLPQQQQQPDADSAVEAAAADGGVGMGAHAAGAAACAGLPAGPMEEDDVAVAAAPAGAGPFAGAAAQAGNDVAAADDIRPRTPMRDKDEDAAAVSAATSGRRSSSGGELMEGLEPMVTRAASAPPGGVDASMPGTPEPSASGAMEDDLAAAPAALPTVILAGPPEKADADLDLEGAKLGPSEVQPFNMWSAQDSAPLPAPDGPSGSAAPLAPAGPPFTIKLCNSKGDPLLWGSSYVKDINKDHNREFLLMFGDACSPAGSGPYSPELLDAPSEHPSLQEHRLRATAGPQLVSLAACMTTFLQPERLAESDAWYCPHCKSHVCADKKLDLWSLPEVLVVHLKRFSYTRYSRTKLDTRVDFPLHGLDLGPYVMRTQPVPPVYDLFAVSNHYGSLGGGHYTAYAKLPSPPPGLPAESAAAEAQRAQDDRWYCFDDSHVSAVDPEAVRSPAAYVLFYRRRSEAAADRPVLSDLLERLKEQRTAAAQAAGGGGTMADGPARGGVGSHDSGSDRHPDQDQDQDQGNKPYGSSRGGGMGAVSIAAAAVAVAAARAGGSGDAGGGGEGDEDLKVAGRSMTAFTTGRRDSGAGGGYRHRSSAGSGGGIHVGTDLYGDGGDAAVAGPSSPMPMSVGNTFGSGGAGGGNHGMPPRVGQYDEPLPYSGYVSGGGGGYDAEDYDAFALDGGGGSAAASGGGSAHGGALMQPPGSPAEPDLNNNDLTCLYDEVEAMDVVRARHSGSDMASAGGNDQDDDQAEDQGHFGGVDGDDGLLGAGLQGAAAHAEGSSAAAGSGGENDQDLAAGKGGVAQELRLMAMPPM